MPNALVIGGTGPTGHHIVNGLVTPGLCTKIMAGIDRDLRARNSDSRGGLRPWRANLPEPM